MKNIHVLPTKPSNKTSNSIWIKETSAWCNIYITSDEEIKDGDYYLYLKDNSVQQFIKKHHIKLLALDIQKKIILATDQDLISDGVQSIDEDFLEWFVKNPSCEEVEVIFTCLEERQCMCKSNDYCLKSGYKIIIPKKEPKKRVYVVEEGCLVPKEEAKQGYICPQTKKQCDDECCVSAENCQIEASIGVIFDNNLPKQETLEEYIFKIPFDYNIKSKEVIDMCMKEQENIILTWRLGSFIDTINSLPDDTEKNRILKSVFDNRDGELLLESYKSMKSHYEK